MKGYTDPIRKERSGGAHGELVRGVALTEIFPTELFGWGGL
jgi:hypothetical protein